MELKKGLVQLYTGNGKGKTTAGLGQAIRASGQGLRVGIIQFFKGRCSGEQRMAKRLNLKIYSFCPVHPALGGERKKAKRECREGLRFAQEIIQSKKYDLIILDEINIATRDRLVEVNDVLTLIKKKPKKVELILTGRGASKKIIASSDLVTEMRKIKHPYQKGVRAKRGIEY
jgi:cob(I)alamin adenosyltransferase